MDQGEALTVLAVDDQEEGLFALETILHEQGYRVLTASRGEEAFAIIQRERPDVVLLDVMMPDITGYEVTARVKQDPDLRYIPVVLVTANDTLEDLVQGFEAGADDYIRKPYKREELLARMRAVVRTHTLYRELREQTEENAVLRGEVGARVGFDSIIGQSSPMQALYKLIDKVRSAHVPVLITGESGTGKELVAKAIHYNSPRKDKPFVVQNCSAFNENLLESELFGHVRGAFTGAVKDKQGLFEVAHGGTFFLDELGEMSAALQVKLLRVLQEGTFTPVGATAQKKVDVRIVAATNRNLRDMISKGTFREDLFYRLNVVNLHLPPLRERRADIPVLVDYFLTQRAKKNDAPKKLLSAEAAKALSSYDWPGNIRELENEVDRAILMSEPERTIGLEMLSPHIGKAGAGTPSAANGAPRTMKDALEQVEREMIHAALARHEGNKSVAARELGISRSSLIAKARLYGFGGDEGES